MPRAWLDLLRRGGRSDVSLLHGESNGSPVVAHLLPHELVKLLSRVTAVQVEGTDTCSSICG